MSRPRWASAHRERRRYQQTKLCSHTLGAFEQPPARDKIRRRVSRKLLGSGRPIVVPSTFCSRGLRAGVLARNDSTTSLAPSCGTQRPSKLTTLPSNQSALGKLAMQMSYLSPPSCDERRMPARDLCRKLQMFAPSRRSGKVHWDVFVAKWPHLEGPSAASGAACCTPL